MSDSENLDIECLILIFFFSDVTNQAIILAFEELKRRIIFLTILVSVSFCWAIGLLRDAAQIIMMNLVIIFAGNSTLFEHYS